MWRCGQGPSAGSGERRCPGLAGQRGCGPCPGASTPSWAASFHLLTLTSWCLRAAGTSHAHVDAVLGTPWGGTAVHGVSVSSSRLPGLLLSRVRCPSPWPSGGSRAAPRGPPAAGSGVPGPRARSVLDGGWAPTRPPQTLIPGQGLQVGSPGTQELSPEGSGLMLAVPEHRVCDGARGRVWGPHTGAREQLARHACRRPALWAQVCTRTSSDHDHSLPRALATCCPGAGATRARPRPCRGRCVPRGQCGQCLRGRSAGRLALWDAPPFWEAL